MLDNLLTPERSGATTAIDLHVGRRIRGKRRALGLSQARLAEALDVATSRIEAYERAVERVSPDHLVQLSEFMGVPLSYFFPARPGPSSEFPRSP